MKRKLIAFITVLAVALAIPVYGFATESTTASDNGTHKMPKTTYTGAAPTFPNAIAQQAIKTAWPYGTSTSKMTYPNGSATAAFQEAIVNAYGTRSGWGKQTKAGASCDVYVGTVIRSCGYDRSFPRGLQEDLKYVPGTKFTKVNITKASEMQPGDIILYNNYGSGGHICIYVEIKGTGYIAEASYSLKRFGRIARKAPNWTPSKYKFFGVYRANSKCIGAIQKGDNSDGVKALQDFLNWAGFDCGTADGAFGTKTETAVKNFQTSQGLTADGKFGTQSYNAARKYTNWGEPAAAKGKNAITTGSGTSAATSSQTAATSSKYTGAMPTKTIKYKKGSKTNIKRWQSFLVWYGYSTKVDGSFGKTTRTLTKKFQSANGLKADGVVGPGTRAKAQSVTK